MSNSKKELNFEESLSSLETLVQSLENDNLSLDQALSAFEKGVKLSRNCQAALEQAEQKVTILLGDTEQPFDTHTLSDD
ncbi:exodeoxyribonuclease VII small subunit [Litoribacillus peritrichatus]|uniref:Exodeoxyribonuclease 7 small subunit n=1 Tax=Litoribacillus peritrichatus TaxID=718191 RepID=A0ABP7LZC4_9GAMM